MLIKDILIFETESMKNAMKRLDKTAEKVLLVVNEESTLLGTITDGDIRRYILKGKSLENDIRGAYNKRPYFLRKEDFSIEKAKDLLIKNKINLIPLLNTDNKPIDFITWNKIFSEDRTKPDKIGRINIPVVIMAGGRGFRLEPFTKILPKPLVPIGDRTIIEIIIDEFKKQGVTKFYITLNNKGKMIKLYLDNIVKDYDIKYVWEKGDFLGTAGSLKLLEHKISDVFIVSNSDVIAKANFEEVLTFHIKQESSLTVVSAMQHYRIPYGVIKYKKGGEIIDIEEKPERTFPINAGIYILNRETIKYIPKKSFFDMTDLVKILVKNNKKVVMYPVNENDYSDIGQWEEYQKAIQKLQIFK